MSTKRNISILVGIIGILILLLTASMGYILANNDNWLKEDTSDKNSKVLKEIRELKSLYDAKIADKTNNFMVLQMQKDSIQNLLSQLEDSKMNEASLLKYKTEFKNLEGKMTVLVDEINILKSKKTKIVLKKEAQIAENIPQKTKNVGNKKSVVKKPVLKEEVMLSKHSSVAEIPSKTVTEIPVAKTKKNSKLSLSNIKAQAFTSKSASKKVETNYASNADLIKISFSLNENPDVESGERTFYFQILNSNNNVMGKRITEYFDSESLTYSFSKSFNYDNQSITISQDFLASNFEKGYYFINIFERDQMVGKTSILLK